MTFLIADSFTDSLARLTGDEQKAAKTTAFDLQMDPSSPGLSFHKLDRAKDKRFWSVRVSQDVRLIVHRTDTTILLCYVDHHDRAYAWAERRKLETHPTTGAAQMIELRESVREIVVPTYVQQDLPKAVVRPLAGVQDEQLLAFGVPAEFLGDLKHADEDGLLALASHLPAEAMEAVLQLATGGSPEPRPVAPVDAFVHPDAQRRFRVVSTVDELAAALDAPWDKWAVFLHPDQRDLVERHYNGPARVVGSAGTGKTVVAVHRAVHLARQNPGWRVLLTTFSDPLAHALRANVRRLLAAEPRVAERLEVHALPTLAAKMYEGRIGALRVASGADVSSALREAATVTGVAATPLFLRSEWDHVVDAWQIESWDAYRTVARLGRRNRLSEARRAELWTVFDAARGALTQKGLLTEAAIFHRLSVHELSRSAPVFDSIIVDESQDLTISQLRFLGALSGGRANALFCAGDLGQRIFQQPFSWKALGVDVRGRSKTLRVNYRTSQQIREHSDRLLGRDVTDADGNSDQRMNTVSVFNGPPPEISTFGNEADEQHALSGWITTAIVQGLKPHEIAIFVRSGEQLDRARAACSLAGMSAALLDTRLLLTTGSISIGTMHLAKGLEFKVVAVMACDDEIIPLQSRIETVGDDGDLEETYESERNLLYVACTRARDALWVSGVRPESEFLADLKS